MATSWLVYIDESGDEGFSFSGENRSSEWLVLSAVIAPRYDELSLVSLTSRARTLLKKEPKKPLHFVHLKHEQRLPYLGLIQAANIKTVSVLIHKPSLNSPESFQERYRMYFYFVRYLLERVSWYCLNSKHLAPPGDGSADVIFSNRSGMSYQELKSYIYTLREMAGNLADVRINWEVIDYERVYAYSPGKRSGLQIADAVAASVFKAVQRSNYGFTEERYLQMLAPTLYRHNGKLLGYGLKFFPWNPKEVEA